MRICQLQNFLLGLFILIFLNSCSTKQVIEPPKLNQIQAHWQKVPLRFTHLDQNGKFKTHPFFDINPAFSNDRRLVNFFITTPMNGPFKYNFNLYSGKLYKDHNYCPTDDIWDSYSGDVYKPNFTQGIVARTYDEDQRPMRIIVFSRVGEVEEFKPEPTHYDTARIVGSLILESCENYPCDLKSKWTSSQILVAVSAKDSAYSQINLLSELKSKVDWPYVKSILVNQDGVHQVGQKFYPAFRVTREMDLDDTFKYLDKFSKVAQMDELQKFREGCFKLYDSIWDNVLKIHQEKSFQQTKFFNYFREFYKEKSQLFYQCSQLVRPATINDNDQRLWFFTFIQAFANLEKNGFFYSCADKAWSYNPKVNGERYFNDQNIELNRCRARDLEKAFDQAINGLSLMKNQINRSFRFIEYDTQRGGSHQKIYGWVETDSKNILCKDQSSSKENKFDIFPHDVEWRRFIPDEDLTIQ